MMNRKKFAYDPVIIIGAPRSGTNMLRDLLVAFPDVGTWPCDEINYIWRHGNRSYPSDAFPENLASPPVIKYIRSQFDKLAIRQGLTTLIEKTCANSLRIPFVRKVIPNARFIFIRRDGFDAVASAIQRWTSRMDFIYTVKKARYVPISDLPYYGCRYLSHRVFRLFSPDKRLRSWGPVVTKQRELLANRDLAAICAIQWRDCVLASQESFRYLPNDTVLSVQYENLVTDPPKELSRILDFVGANIFGASLEQVALGITAANIGKARRQLTPEQLASINPIVNSV